MSTAGPAPGRLAVRRWSSLALCAALMLPLAARAKIPEDKIKVGLLDSPAGSYVERTEHSASIAAEMAAEDFATEGRLDAEIHDHAGKPDDDLKTVEDWLDKEHIAIVIDVAGSASTAAVSSLLRERNRTLVVIDAAGAALDGQLCAPTTVRWMGDPAALAESLARAVIGQGGKQWFVIAEDTPLEQGLAAAVGSAVTSLGGTVAGTATNPLGGRNLHAPLMQAASSGASVVALGESGPELANALLQAAQLGVPTGRTIAALRADIVQVDQTGLQAAQGLVLATPYYWNRDGATRRFATRFSNRVKNGQMPTAVEAGIYSATLALLHAARAANSIDGDAVVAALRRAPIKDTLLGTVQVRPDGIATHPVQVYRVKRPDQAMQAWDYYDLVTTIPAEQAFAGVPSRCPGR